MKRKLLSVLFAVVICFSAAIPVCAEESLSRLMDDADLLTDSEETSLLSQLDNISENQEMDIVVVTTDSLEGYTPQEYADNVFDYCGYGIGENRDGLLLLVSIEDNDWHISTSGYAITAFTDAGREYMSEQFLPYLSDGEYYKAFSTYADLCDQFITQAKTDEPYDVGNLPKEPFKIWFNVLIALGIGFVFAIIVVLYMKSKLKSVRFQPAASSYVRNGSMNVTQSGDFFLYSHLDRRARPKDNDSGGSSTHTSSSGSTHGGGGGKF
ncbi:MAG: TPM domain-containing protein [Ruminococcus sp.]|nr:TPM domain-containing protein [Ruminococcus sp.]